MLLQFTSCKLIFHPSRNILTILNLIKCCLYVLHAHPHANIYFRFYYLLFTCILSDYSLVVLDAHSCQCVTTMSLLLSISLLSMGTSLFCWIDCVYREGDAVLAGGYVDVSPAEIQPSSILYWPHLGSQQTACRNSLSISFWFVSDTKLNLFWSVIRQSKFQIFSNKPFTHKQLRR